MRGRRVEQRRARLAEGFGECFGADRLDAHGWPWTPVDCSGQVVEAAGVERPICKRLTNSHLRVVAAEIGTLRYTPRLGSILFPRLALAGKRLRRRDFRVNRSAPWLAEGHQRVDSLLGPRLIPRHDCGRSIFGFAACSRLSTPVLPGENSRAIAPNVRRDSPTVNEGRAADQLRASVRGSSADPRMTFCDTSSNRGSPRRGSINGSTTMLTS